MTDSLFLFCVFLIVFTPIFTFFPPFFHLLPSQHALPAFPRSIYLTRSGHFPSCPAKLPYRSVLCASGQGNQQDFIREVLEIRQQCKKKKKRERDMHTQTHTGCHTHTQTHRWHLSLLHKKESLKQKTEIEITSHLNISEPLELFHFYTASLLHLSPCHKFLSGAQLNSPCRCLIVLQILCFDTFSMFIIFPCFCFLHCQ